MLWWNSLSRVWKKAFNVAYLNRPVDYSPTNEEINDIYTCKVLRLVGPTGQYPTIDEPLQDLSGLRELRDLEILILTHHQIRKLDELKGFNELRTLFIHNNE
ncbi:MAG: hypothetical protein KKG00_03585, partial [Bacteroidetes bacterium]|nr:hypothetical protein [Bacteroidota bacterium]